MRYAFAAFLMSSIVAAQPSSPADQHAMIEKQVAPLLKDRKGVGVVVGISNNGKTEVHSFGKITLAGQEVEPTGDTMFEIGSITKAFTGTLLAELVRTGACQLDDPVQKYLPAEIKLPRRDNRDITLLHLATHTSGLPVQPPTLPIFAMFKPSGPTNPYKHYMKEDLANSLKNIELKRAIGCAEEYSNLGTGILGHALAGAAKTSSYEELLQMKILRPLRMTSTRITLTDDDREKRMAPGHDAKGQPNSTWDFGCLEACGGIRSTVNDMLLFGRAALAAEDSAPLTPAFRVAQQPWRELPKGNKTYVGLNWMNMPSPSKKHTMIWHNGGTGGYRSFLGLIPGKKLVVVLLTNISQPADRETVGIIQELEQLELK